MCFWRVVAGLTSPSPKDVVQGRPLSCLSTCVQNRFLASIPFPLADLWHVFPMLGDVLFVFDAFIPKDLFGVVGLRATQGDPVDDVSNEMEPIEIVHNGHIERGRRCPFFLITPHM